MTEPSVIIIGAGVSGLTTALALHCRGIETLVLEARPFVGGAAHTLQRDGYLCETGPNTVMLLRPETGLFLKETGILDSALDAAPDAQKRFVVRKGKLTALPSSPAAFLTCSVLSWKAKLRMTREPWIAPGKDENETLADFVRRRLGEEPLRELVGPFVSGVYAGDPERLVVRHALPRLYNLEQKYGSLIRGAIGMRKAAAQPKGRMISWPGGLSELASRLASPLGDRVRLSTEVGRLKHADGVFLVETDRETFRANRVALAADALNAAKLLRPICPAIRALETLPHAPVTVLHLGFERTAVAHPLDGFGALISRARGIRTLGALFSSTLFPGRAPPGCVLLTAFIGGMLDPSAPDLDDAALFRIVMEDLAPLLGIRTQPVFQNIVRWPRAIPQYDRDHPRMLEAIGAAETALPGLSLIGNYRGGISMGDCIANALALAARLSVA